MATSIDGPGVSAWLKLPAPSAEDAALLDEIAASVSAWVNDFAPLAGRTEAGDWTSSTSLGAKMLAGRLWRRRNSPNGVEVFTDQGAAYVSRFDPDVARMLRLNVPRVG